VFAVRDRIGAVCSKSDRNARDPIHSSFEIALPKALLRFRASSANRSILKSHRTTARGFLVLLLAGVFTGTADAASVPAVTAFPVVGNVRYIDDFGDPRPQGPHEGNDIMSIRHQPAVAFEAGTVEKWAHPNQAVPSCMLVLHGDSGMEYWYIHLNNDLGATNDNDAGCSMAYAPGLRNGQHVRRGQLVGFVGDSGDANGIQPHLHFEVHRPSGTAIDPYTYLNKAKRLLYPRPAAADPISLAFRKATVVETGTDTLTISTKRIRVSTWEADYARSRQVVLSVAPTATFECVTSTGRSAVTLSSLRAGMVVGISTTQFTPSWTTQRAAAGVLSLEHLAFR
jgi:peptidoglycan LD-endopeptidase LytH